MLFTSLFFCGVGRVVYPSWEATPRSFQGRGNLTAPCQIAREDVAIVDICHGGFWSDCSFVTACPRAVTLTALQTVGVSLRD